MTFHFDGLVSKSVVCPLCVQWRCICCRQDNGECSVQPEFEPYWPDGSVAVLTQDNYCERAGRNLRAEADEYTSSLTPWEPT